MKKRNKYNYGKSSERRLPGVSDFLQMTARRALLCSPVDFGISWMGGVREDEEQHEIFIEGNSRCDGYKKSFHQKKVNGKGQALDLVPYVAGIGFAYAAAGRYFIRLRQYLAHPIYDVDGITIISSYGLDDDGLTPTQADLDAIAVGSVPPQLLIDSVHLATEAWTVIGKMIYKRCYDLNIL